jgi:chromatin segregation and condensation protein Rec8/ScpA/Scc1 (kleisin family)
MSIERRIINHMARKDAEIVDLKAERDELISRLAEYERVANAIIEYEKQGIHGGRLCVDELRALREEGK